ncbi:MAG TPA: ABC transporter ATP-binding protein [Acidimicrobiales bacterium]|nr:ABC transporter ATP-binding protein [Acidimicrobiales bacterium]
MSVAAVEAIDLTKTYANGVEAVKGISFRIEPGEAFGLLGPNGAGKSTTIGMLSTTVIPTSGRALLGGRDVARDPLGVRAISSVVFQDAVVDRPLTGRQNLELHLRLWGKDDAVGRAALDHLSKLVGLSEYLDRPVATYSGGQRRRMEIVRALVSEPKVVFLDEPTVGLDTRIRHDLFDVLATLRDETGVTILLTTHYLDEAERLADRLAIVDAGRIVATDTPANLLAALGDQVLEVRVDDARGAARSLAGAGVASDDVCAVGTTITASLRGARSDDLLARLRDDGVTVRSSTTRQPNLDDVYLRLTGDRISAASDE